MVALATLHTHTHILAAALWLACTQRINQTNSRHVIRASGIRRTIRACLCVCAHFVYVVIDCEPPFALSCTRFTVAVCASASVWNLQGGMRQLKASQCGIIVCFAHDALFEPYSDQHSASLNILTKALEGIIGKKRLNIFSRFSEPDINQHYVRVCVCVLRVIWCFRSATITWPLNHKFLADKYAELCALSGYTHILIHTLCMCVCVSLSCIYVVITLLNMCIHAVLDQLMFVLQTLPPCR